MPLRRSVIILVFGVVLAAGFVTSAVSKVLGDPGGALVYPKAHKGDQVDDYHGVKVADPYRWLEDDYSDATRAWVKAQNKVTFGYLEQIPARKKINKRLTELWNYEKFGVPGKRGGRYFFRKNDGLQNHFVLYTMKSLDDEPKVLLDPNKLSEDGTISLSGTAVSEDGQLLAYGLSVQGSDWQEWKVRNIETRKDLDDHLKWVKRCIHKSERQYWQKELRVGSSTGRATGF